MQRVSECLDQAEQALLAGQLDQASESLERARSRWAQEPPTGEQAQLDTERGRQLQLQLTELREAEALAASYEQPEQAPSSADLDEEGGVPLARLAPGIPDPPSPEQLLARMGLEGFRPGQREAVAAALAGRDSLVVMPTGGGKSLCYQLPGIASGSLTVVVSPLIALIQDQHQRLVEAGHRSVMLASSQGEEENLAALDAIRSGRAQLVFCAPERMASQSFRRALAQRAIALFVVDEAHCVAEWGHDFRPDYLRLTPVIEELGRPPVMACTATATPQVAEEIIERLGLREPEVVRRGFDRPNLSFDVVALDGKGAVGRKRDLLLGGLAQAENLPALVYCGTRRDTEKVAELLSERGLKAGAYHAGMPGENRRRVQEQFMSGELQVVVATNAFGMGVDKADIRSVWHWALPTSVEAYYQEAGRAGRDGKPARAVLLAMRGDLGRLIQFIRAAELEPQDVLAEMQRLQGQAQDGAVVRDSQRVEDRERIAWSIAERAGGLALEPAGGGQLRLRLLGRLDGQAVQRMCRAATNRRWEAYKALKAFAVSDTCRRRQLLDHFGDDEPVAPLGRCCDVCDPSEWLSPAEPASRPAKQRSGRAAAQAPTVEESPELDALRAWRRERAGDKPAYTVATNAALAGLLQRRPTSEAELLEVSGIGPAFVAKHGEAVLELLGSLD